MRIILSSFGVVRISLNSIFFQFQVNIKKLLGIESSDNRLIYRTPLTLLKTEEQIDADDDVNFCPMDVKAFVIQR